MVYSLTNFCAILYLCIQGHFKCYACWSKYVPTYVQKSLYVFIYITVSTFASVCPYVPSRPVMSVCLLCHTSNSCSNIKKLDWLKLFGMCLEWKVYFLCNCSLWGKANHVFRLGKAELSILKLPSMFHHLPSVFLKWLFALADLRCTYEAGTYSLGYYVTICALGEQWICPLQVFSIF